MWLYAPHAFLGGADRWRQAQKEAGWRTGLSRACQEAGFGAFGVGDQKAKQSRCPCTFWCHREFVVCLFVIGVCWLCINSYIWVRCRSPGQLLADRFGQVGDGLGSTSSRLGLRRIIEAYQGSSWSSRLKIKRCRQTGKMNEASIVTNTWAQICPLLITVSCSRQEQRIQCSNHNPRWRGL